MKKIFSIIVLIVLINNLSAQTNPAPQTLPVSINFATANFTPPFTNMVAWTGDGTRPYFTQAAAEASLPGANTTSVFNTTPASGGSGGQYGHAVSGDARLTILQSGNATNGSTQAALAINTLGVTSATISYDLVLTVPNPRDIGVVLQYRVGTSGSFTSISGSNVLYNNTTSNGGDADGANDFDNYIFNLPAGALGQAEVQIRWATWQSSTTGARNGIGIDNISITSGAISPCAEPTNQPTGLNLTPSPTTITGSFTAAVPMADNYLVVRSLSATLSSNPVDGTVYPEASALGGGVVVSNGNSTSFSDIGLTPSTLYYYFVYAYNSYNCSGAPNYLNTNPLTGSVSTAAVPPCTTPPAPPTNLNLTPYSTSVSGTFTAVTGANRYLVVRSLNNTLSFSPLNGTTYSSNQIIGPDVIVSYNGNTSFFASGLNSTTTYYFFVFAANGDCAGEPFYSALSVNATATTTAGGSGIPPGYYNGATGLTCAQLKTALFTIISSGTTPLSYSPGVWDAYQTTDMHRNDANTADIIWDMYSDNPAGPEPYTYTFGTNQCGNYGQEGDCYNREHSFPQSWFNSASPMKSDLHHLFPTDGKVNGMRDNNPYGEVSAPTWTSQNGGKLGPNTYPGFSGTVFEPRNEYKGDFARGQLYMVTRYESQVAGWQGNGNANDVLNGTAYPAFDDWYIKLMYKWHQQDPVSQKEIDRNNAVYALQGNRNPFIDHPEYVFDVWNCTGVIPVTLLDFSATKNNKSVLLVWHTAQETNFKKYVVERSIDGRNFFSLGEIMGRNLGVYDFTDNNLPDKTWAYYRLKMINADGSFTFSYIVSVRLSKNFSGSVVYPNPAKDVVQIKLQQSLTEVSNLIITDISGRNMLQRKISSGQNSISLNVNNLSAGRYFVTIRNSSVIIQDNFTLIK